MTEDDYMQNERLSEVISDELPEWAEKGRVDSIVGIQREESLSGTGSRSRLRSIECTSIEVSILSSELVPATEKNSAHITYIIQVSPGASKRWNVKRRYNDFVYLDNQLRKPTGQQKVKLPTLPTKRYFRSSTEPKFVEERRGQLEDYLREIMTIPQAWIRSDLPRFLDNESNSMIFLWNFERVKKMQEIVNTMTIESNTDKQKLTGELHAAKQQVSMLQNRINRMEMMFLQHAAGLASENLPPSVVRSISAVNAVDADLVTSLSHLENIDLDDSTHEKAKLSTSPDTASASFRSGFDSGHDTEQGELSEHHMIIEEAVRRHVSDGKLMDGKDVIEILAMTRQSKIKESSFPNRASSEEEIRAWALSSKLKEALELGNEVLDEKYYLEDMSKKASFSLRSDVDSLSSASARPDSSRKVSDQEVENSIKFLLAYDPTQEIGKKEPKSSLSLLSQYFDQLIVQLTPTNEGYEDRVRIFEYLRSMLYTTLNVHIFPVGSFVSKTYLPFGDMDVTAFFLHQDDECWFVRVNEMLCMSAFGGNSYYTLASLPGQLNSLEQLSESDTSSKSRFTLNNVSFVNADTKLIKSSINGVSIDLSANQIGALYFQSFLESINSFVGQDNLFKRSILLIKAWCNYESHKYSRGTGSVTGSSDGRLSTSSLNVMTMWIFNAYGGKIKAPLQALYFFLSFFSTFDWNKYAITIAGPLSAMDLSPVTYPFDGDIQFYFPNDLLNENKDRYADAREAFILNALAPYLPRQEKHAASSDPATAQVAEESSQSNAPALTLPPELLDMKSMISDSWISHAAFDDSASFYKRGLMNVINPVTLKNNLSRTVDSFGYRAIQHAFYDGFIAFKFMIARVFNLRVDNKKPVTLVQYLMSSSTESMTKEAIDRHGHESFDTAKDNDILANVVDIMTNTCVNVVVPLLRGTHSIASGRRITPLTSASTSPAVVPHPIDSTVASTDILANSSEDMEFSLSFAEMILGCKVRTDALITIVIQILTQRGSLPVGEIGKLLQLLTGGDSISRRLKDQLGGLKRTIEAASESGIKVGTDHPFNPILSLEAKKAEGITEESRLIKFNHAAKIVRFILSSNIKDASTVITNTQSKGWASSSVAALSTTPTKKHVPSVASGRNSAYSPQGNKNRNMPTEVIHARKNVGKANFPSMSSVPAYGNGPIYGGPGYMSTDSYDEHQFQMSISPSPGGGMMMQPGYADTYDSNAAVPMTVPMMPTPPVYMAAPYYVPMNQPQVVYASYSQQGAMAPTQLSVQQQQQFLMQQQYQQQYLAQQQMQYGYYAQGNPPQGMEVNPTADPSQTQSTKE